MLGMLDFVLTLFNRHLSIETEKVIGMKWVVRKARFKQMGLEFGAVFANVHTIKAGSKYKAVKKIVGMLFYR